MRVSASVTHSNCSLPTLTLFSKTHRQEDERMLSILENGIATEVVVIKTCNRYEIFMNVEGEGFDEGLKKLFGDDYDLMSIRRGREAVMHLFEVSTTLDSMILGEHQILGQVRKALEKANELGTVGDSLTPLFERAIKAGRRVRSETELCQGNVSMASVAVGVAKDRLGDLEGKDALILGAGKISSMMAKILSGKGMGSVMVTNRDLERAQKLAEETGAKAVAYEIFRDYLPFVDIVLCASSAPHPLLFKKDLKWAMSMGKEDLVIVDIAMPPDVEAEARELRGIEYIGLDAVRDVSKSIEEARKEHIPKARQIIDEEYRALKMQEQARERKELIKAISIHVESIRQRELEKLITKHGNGQDDIDAFSKAVVKKALHNLFCNIQDLDLPIEDLSHIRDLMLKVPEREGVDTCFHGTDQED